MPTMTRPGPATRLITFHFEAPEAAAVAVAGDFNNWDPAARPLRRRKDGVWFAMLRLRPGAHQYKFVVNGAEWREDPAQPERAPNPYGAFNSVLRVA